MNRLNRKVEYALISLRHMARKSEGLTTAKELSEAYKTPFDATSKVLQMMSQSGLLKSEQGVHGGYRIVGDLRACSMRDLLRIIDGDTALVKCLHKDQFKVCEIQDTCNILSPIQKLDQKFNEFLSQVKIQEILEGP